MDIFSLGCVIPELFLEGQPLFELSKLLAYRRGQYDPSQSLEKIPDSGIRKMILHMIQLDPKSRLSDDSFRVTSLHFFIIFFSCFIPLDSDTRVAVTQSAFHDIHKQMKNNRLNVEIRGGISRTCSLSESERSPQVMEGGNLILNSPKESSKKKGELDEGLFGNQFQLLGDISTLIKDVEQRNHSSNAVPCLKMRDPHMLQFSGAPVSILQLRFSTLNRRSFKVVIILF